jgi:hypothetical protein
MKVDSLSHSPEVHTPRRRGDAQASPAVRGRGDAQCSPAVRGRGDAQASPAVRGRGDAQAEGLSARRRGAQPGNTNALKHGFYSRQLQETSQGNTLDEEISMLRTVIRRVFDHLQEDDLGLGTLSKALDTLGSASTRLARLLRAKKELDNASVENDAFAQALDEVVRELGIEG